VGGDLVRIRLFTRLGMSGTMVAASLVADRTLTVAALIAFTLLGLVLLTSFVTADGIVLPVLLAALVGMLLLGSFYVAQQRGLFGALARMLQTFGGSLTAKMVDGANALDRDIRQVYARRNDVLLSVFWLSAAWLLGVLEVWLALWLLGYPVSLLEAFLIESLVQGIRAAAFLIPGALGAQEGGFLVVGTLLGVPADAALALALTRRVRELAFGIPGILAWQWFEARSQWSKKRASSAVG
jgi:putative membrane protein